MTFMCSNTVYTDTCLMLHYLDRVEQVVKHNTGMLSPYKVVMENLLAKWCLFTHADNISFHLDSFFCVHLMNGKSDIILL